jgi:hypothetical protein
MTARRWRCSLSRTRFGGKVRVAWAIEFLSVAWVRAHARGSVACGLAFRRSDLITTHQQSVSEIVQRNVVCLIALFVCCLFDRCATATISCAACFWQGVPQNLLRSRAQYVCANSFRKSSCSGCTANDISRKQFVRNFDQRGRTLV